MSRAIIIDRELKAHSHQCGRVTWGFIEEYGCRHVWTHVRDYSKTLANDHMCPECGKGPWYEVVDE